MRMLMRITITGLVLAAVMTALWGTYSFAYQRGYSRGSRDELRAGSKYHRPLLLKESSRPAGTFGCILVENLFPRLVFATEIQGTRMSSLLFPFRNDFGPQHNSKN